MRLCRRFAPTPFRLPIPIFNFGGVYWTKFETISGKIRRILTNDTCASPALDKLARGKTQKFPIIFICGSPHTPPPQGGKFERKEIFGFAAAASKLTYL
jgi:hypothetical protein